jgi:pectin methylesterase-like acyl-CoA thioesterase
MISLPWLLSTLLFAGQAALALSPTFINCQVQKPEGESALTGCPDGTLLVAADGSGDFANIMDAVNSLEEDEAGIILIAEGEYHENVNITRSAPLTLLVSIMYVYSLQL